MSHNLHITVADGNAEQLSELDRLRGVSKCLLRRHHD